MEMFAVMDKQKLRRSFGIEVLTGGLKVGDGIEYPLCACLSDVGKWVAQC